MRVWIVSAAALVAAVSFVAVAGAGRAVRSCRTVEKGGSTEAVFGHFATRAQALAFLHGVAERKGFKGLVVEDDGCGDFEVENPGIAQGQRPAFVLEAAQTALQVSFEETTPTNRPVRGFVNAVFGTTASIGAAEKVRLKVAGVGFRYLDVVYDASRRWRILAPHIPVRTQAAFRAEAARAKLRVTFAKS